MGKRGPKPTPIAIKKQRGTRIRKEHGGIEAPKGYPPRPEGMKPNVAAFWDFYAASAYDLGTLSPHDHMKLQRLAEASATVNEQNRILEERGYYQRVGHTQDAAGQWVGGHFQLAPAVSVRNFALNLEKGLLDEFGFSPSSRARLNLTIGQTRTPEEENPDLALLD